MLHVASSHFMAEFVGLGVFLQILMLLLLVPDAIIQL